MKIGLRRLRKLAAHLMRGKLGHAKFYFGAWNSAQAPECGTAGCAVGECPVIFRKQWRWKYNGNPALRNNSQFDPIYDAAAFFDLSAREAYHLFIPGEQAPDKFVGTRLDRFAKRKDVARNIIAFIKLREKETV